METPDGAVVGRHDGLMYYTLGQRKGLGIGGRGSAWYVAGKDMRRNVLKVVQGHDHPALLKRSLMAAELSWVAGQSPKPSETLSAKTRYRQRDAACHIAELSTDTCAVEFAAPQWAITPGQSFVAYAGDVCVGGESSQSEESFLALLLQPSLFHSLARGRWMVSLNDCRFSSFSSSLAKLV